MMRQIVSYIPNHKELQRNVDRVFDEELLTAIYTVVKKFSKIDFTYQNESAPTFSALSVFPLEKPSGLFRHLDKDSAEEPV